MVKSVPVVPNIAFLESYFFPPLRGVGVYLYPLVEEVRCRFHPREALEGTVNLLLRSSTEVAHYYQNRALVKWKPPLIQVIPVAGY